MTDQDEKAPLAQKPLRPITKTEFKELSSEARLSVLQTEAHRLDENCLPDALMTLAQAFTNLGQSFGALQINVVRLQKALDEMPPIEDQGNAK